MLLYSCFLIKISVWVFVIDRNSPTIDILFKSYLGQKVTEPLSEGFAHSTHGTSQSHEKDWTLAIKDHDHETLIIRQSYVHTLIYL